MVMIYAIYAQNVSGNIVSFVYFHHELKRHWYFYLQVKARLHSVMMAMGTTF